MDPIRAALPKPGSRRKLHPSSAGFFIRASSSRRRTTRMNGIAFSGTQMNTTTAAVGAKPIKDPQPSVDRIDDLAKRILNGDIYLPKFQREFIWERQQVLDLLDSVARNYPIGSILLWQSKQELRSESKIADLEILLPKPDY